MSDMSTLLAPIRERETAATEGPWEVRRGGDFQNIQIHAGSLWIDVVDGSHQTPPDGEWIDSPDIDFIASARTDIPRLLSALEAVEALAQQWHARGEHDMAFSKTIQDEDIAMELLTHGAGMVENARHIRNAVTAALGEQA